MSSLWQPTGDCGAACLPVAPPRVSWPRYAARMVAGALVVLASVLAKPMIKSRPALVRFFARALLAALGVQLSVRGKPRPGLLVANHVSWVDVLVLMALDGRVRLVAKREVGRWPVIGPIASALGAIYVDRSSPRDLPRTVATATAALRRGESVAVFPEATTTCGFCRVPMRPAFFQAAVDAGVRVTPIALGFRAAGSRSAVAAFVGTDDLLSSVRRIARTRDLSLTVGVGRALFTEPATDRRALARLAEVTVRHTPGPVRRAQTHDVSRFPLLLSGAADYH